MKLRIGPPLSRLHSSCLWILALPVRFTRQDTLPSRSAPGSAIVRELAWLSSGGGALGLAEIGVIQWMEENHIPVDRIAGTSMGSIIGAMYATGMSPAEIQEFAEKIDWDKAFLPEPAYTAALLSPEAGSPRLSGQRSSRPEARTERAQRFQSRPGRGIAAGSHCFLRNRVSPTLTTCRFHSAVSPPTC